MSPHEITMKDKKIIQISVSHCTLETGRNMVVGESLCELEAGKGSLHKLGVADTSHFFDSLRVMSKLASDTFVF